MRFNYQIPKPKAGLMDVRVLLIAEEGESRENYIQAFQSAGAAYDVVVSFESFLECVSETPYNGLVLDIPTKMKAFRQHQDFARRVVDKFPTLLVKWDPKLKSIKAIATDAQYEVETLVDFVRIHCRHAVPKRFRAHLRRNVNFNVILSESSALEPQGMSKSATLNVSRGGCFVFCTTEYHRGTELWLMVNEFEDKSAIKATICHQVRWGREMKLPGIGLEFVRISASQSSAIDAYF